MKVYVINGKFMADRMQGIVRYGRELLNALDKLLQEDEKFKIILAVPNGNIDIPKYKHIKVKTIGNKQGIIWEQVELRKYIKKNKGAILINFCNVTPFFVKPGITAVHDIMYKTFPQNYKSIRNKISRLWHCIQYKYIFKHEKIILTVSEFSKKEIEHNYPEAKGKIRIVPNGWQHVLSYPENSEGIKKYDYLEAGEYYFSLATLAPNKNINWTIEVAKRNPDLVFAIAGKIYGEKYKNLPPNVHLLGFVSDEDACSLIKNCKAFLFPSLYEGFGIPPLEALGLGARVISSKTSSLPEVLGESASYFDPEDYNVNLDDIFKEKVNKEALEKYNWLFSAQSLKKILEDYKWV